LGDGPVIEFCVNSITASGIEDVVIVLRPGDKELFDVVSSFPLRVVFNENPESEMADSVRTGLRQIGPSATGVVICLSDHPMVTEETFRSLMKMHGKCPDKILIPI
jgi:CTP:molybdopterin cytidylyltransferase MocA